MKVKIEIELEPCPFCGNTDLLVGTSNEIRLDGDEDNFAVCCDVDRGGCGACSGYALSRLKAVEYWNKRSEQNAK